MASDNSPAPVIPQSKPAASPWSKVTSPAPCSLQDVMGEELSEELAKKLQVEEENKFVQSAGATAEEDLTSLMLTDTKGDIADDYVIAQMLQNQFNQEFDDQLRREENKINGTSKVRLSFDNYRQSHENDEKRESAEEEEEEEDSIPKFKKGYIGKGKNIVTKHDEKFTYQKNSNKVMDFPPEFDTGDVRGKEYRLPNKVYNQLKSHSNIDNKRKYRLHEKKEHSTAEMAVDERTRLILYKLMNNQILERINGVISTGKESVIMHADGGVMDTGFIPKECAIKVFKTTLTDFKNRTMYIHGDVRLHKDEYKKKNPRKIIKIWAEKEEFNLKRLKKCGIPCPTMVILKKHCLVMSFIGSDRKAAPKLKDAHLGPADIMDAYEQCLENMMKMYNSAGLVHGDLSEYNLLWHNGTLYFIDVSQSVDRFHPHAMHFLLRDCRNVCEFFSKAGVPEVPSHFELFNKITGRNFEGTGKEFLSQIDDYEKNEERLRLDKGKDYNFDFFFEQAQKEHKSQQENSAANDEESESEESDDDDDDDEEDVDQLIDKI